MRHALSLFEMPAGVAWSWRHTAHVCGGLLRLNQKFARNQGLKAPVTRALVLTESSRTRSSKNNNTAVEYSNPIHEQPRLVL
jgi:hypothetical protein